MAIAAWMTTPVMSSCQAELLELRNAHRAHARHHHRRQYVDGVPDAVAAQNSVEQRRQRHHQSADHATLDPSGEWMHRFRETGPIAGHPWPKLLHFVQLG